MKPSTPRRQRRRRAARADRHRLSVDLSFPTAEKAALAVGASTMIAGVSGASGQTAFGEQTGIVEVIGPFVIPTDRQGNIVLREYWGRSRSGACRPGPFSIPPLPRRTSKARSSSSAPVCRAEGPTFEPARSHHGGRHAPRPSAGAVDREAIWSAPIAAGAEDQLITALGIAIIVLFAVPKVGTLAATALGGGTTWRLVVWVVAGLYRSGRWHSIRFTRASSA